MQIHESATYGHLLTSMGSDAYIYASFIYACLMLDLQCYSCPASLLLSRGCRVIEVPIKLVIDHELRASLFLHQKPQTLHYLKHINVLHEVSMRVEDVYCARFNAVNETPHENKRAPRNNRLKLIQNAYQAACENYRN